MRTLLARASRLLPPGTQLVFCGVAVLGVAAYVQLAAAGHRLDTPSYSALSVLWSLVIAIGLGLFFPVEQELTRIVAARAVRGEGASPTLRRALVLTLVMTAVLTLLMWAFIGPLAHLLFGGDRAMVWAFAAVLLGTGLVYLTRGIQAGLGLFQAYGASLALDGGLRLVFSVALAVAGVRSVLAYALVLAVAPFLAMLLTLPPTLRASRPGPQQPWGELVRGTGLLICSQLMAQFMVNASVLSAQLLAPTRTALVASLLSAGVLARASVSVFSSIQPTLMTSLSTAAEAGDRRAFRATLLRTAAVVGGLGLAVGVPVVALGPWLIKVVFHAPAPLGSLDFLWFSVGTTGYTLALVVGQALLVMHHHRRQLLGWLLGTAVLVAITLAPGDIAVRVELAYALGATVTAVALLLMLVRIRPVSEETLMPAPRPVRIGGGA